MQKLREQISHRILLIRIHWLIGGRVDDIGGFEIENDVMHQLVANAVCGKW